MRPSASVPPRDITDHLAANICEIENINVASIQQAMTKWRREYPRMPKYINRHEDGQKNSARASLPIPDKWLMDITTSSIFSENSYPIAQEKYEKLPITEKIWAKWKNHFVGSQAALERATKDIGGSFGRTNTAAAFHGTSDPHTTDEKVPSITVENLDGYLDKLSAATTNKIDVLNRLVANNNRLTSTIAITLAEIKKLLLTH